MFARVLGSAILTITIGAGIALAQYPYMPNPYRRNPFPQETFHERLANQWVRHYLNRSATSRDLTVIMSQLRAGRTHEEVQANIIASDEYFRRSGNSMTNFVRRAIIDVTGRNPSAAEVGMTLSRAFAKGRYRFALELLISDRGIGCGTPNQYFPLNYRSAFFPFSPF